MAVTEARVEISNWKDVVDQFGLAKRDDGYYNAKQISYHLKQGIMATGGPVPNISVPVGEGKEAICCFVLDYEADGPGGSSVYYTYQGTAS